MNKKKNIFATILLLAVTLSANAQSWGLSGNTGTNTTTHFIGTRDIKDLIFRTNNVPRMYIRSDGGVGIIDPGSNPNTNSHPKLLYLEKYSPGIALHINMFSTTNGSPAIYAASGGPGSSIHGNASQAGSTAVFGENFQGYGLQGTSYNSYGLVTRSTNYYGMVAIGKTYAAYFVGGVFASNGYHAPSDQKLKYNIRDVTSAMDIINQLHPKKYHYRQDGNHKLMKLPQEEQYGLLAQDVEKVLPDLVKDTKFETFLETDSIQPDANGKFNIPQKPISETVDFKALNYMGFIPILIKGMQEQHAQIKEQQEKINQQDKKIENLTALVNQVLSVRSLGNTGSIITDAIPSNALLTQNAPNPFHQTTTINYYVPQQADNAVITITDIKGRVIKTYNVAGQGSGQLKIEGGQLVPGTYHYSLMVDGKITDTKKMILLK